LRAGDSEKWEESGWRRRCVSRRSTWTRHRYRHLGLVFAPSRTAGAPLHRSERWGHQGISWSLVLTAARAAAAPLLHRRAKV
jgi:hypothetical protein